MTDITPATLDLGREFTASDLPVSNLSAGGACVALGSLGVTATSVLYALSPPAAALPAQPFDQAAALAGALAGQSSMHWAGTIGIFSDIVMAVGALLVALELARRGTRAGRRRLDRDRPEHRRVYLRRRDCGVCARSCCRDARRCRRICRVQAFVRCAFSVGDHGIRDRGHARLDERNAGGSADREQAPGRGGRVGRVGRRAVRERPVLPAFRCSRASASVSGLVP